MFMIVFVKYTISWLTNGSFCVVNILSRSQSGILLIIVVNTDRRFFMIRASKVLPVRSWYAFLFFMALVVIGWVNGTSLTQINRNCLKRNFGLTSYYKCFP